MKLENSPSHYRGWNSRKLANGLIELQVVPEIGGRVIQFRAGDKEFFWVNPLLPGKTSPPSGLGPNGEWLNYGGDKLWPAPQGWEGPHEWPGPPDAILDGSPHTLELPAARADEARLRLTSLPDQRSGIQFIREISIDPTSTHVTLEVTMKNIDVKPRRWGIWTVSQINGAGPDGKGFNGALAAYCPINPASRFQNGYAVMRGPEDNPTWQPQAHIHLFKLGYKYQVGKVGLDSQAGWVATVDGRDGWVFVQHWTPEPGKAQPDNATVEFWSSGLGAMFSRNRHITMSDDPAETPFLIESELLSPFAQLEPGQSYRWKYEWNAANIGGNFPVVDANTLGVVAEPLRVFATKSGTEIRGRFGVFQRGTARTQFYNAQEKVLDGPKIAVPVSPLAPLVIAANVEVPSAAAKVEVILDDERGHALGCLAKINLPGKSTP